MSLSIVKASSETSLIDGSKWPGRPGIVQTMNRKKVEPELR
jgi:hypothetical protein